MSRAAHSLTPAHPAIRAYLKALGEYRSLGVEHELGLRSAFQNLLDATARLQGWALFVEQSARSGGRNIRFDGTLRDRNSLPRGYWEAKDSRDDLDREIERKIRSGYFTTNTIFEDTRHAVLFQDRNRVLTADLSDPLQIADLLARFLSYTEPDIQG
ncbi:MAG: DNA helicase, partial [Acidobacteria bacterium]|nr:DNA helicase [Acidobacteriota bacterium]